jgi:hypothetical protein
MSLPLGYFIQYIYRKSLAIKIAISIIIVLLVMLNLFQAWQLRNSILSQSLMTYEYYVSSFGKTKVDYYKKAELCLIERSNKNSIPDESKYNKSILKTFNKPLTEDPTNTADSIVYNGNLSFKIDSTNDFYTLLKLPYKDLTKFDHAWLRVNMYLYIDVDFENSSVILATTFLHNGKGYHYKSIEFDKLIKNNKIKLGSYNKIKLVYLTPEVRSKNDELMIHIWNKGKKTFYIDDISIELFEPFPK